jgi:lipoprotein-releasing system permease protein
MWFLAVRHLLSRKRQTALILSGISLGTMIYVMIAGVQLGLRQFIVDKLINNDAHVKISGREEIITPENMTPLFFPQSKNVIRWIVPPSGKRDEARILYPQGWFQRFDRDPDVAAYAPQFQVQAIFRRGAIKVAGQIIGINVEKQKQVTTLNKDISEGKLDAIGGGSNRVVLGSGLAKKLGARLDESIFVSTGTGRATPYKIVGIYHSGIQQLDDTISYGSILDIQQLAGTPGRVTNIAVKLNDVALAKPAAQKWGLTSTDKVQSWEEANSSILQIFKIQDIVRIFITSTVLIVAAFGIYNVLSIIISQKKREIAILRALGFSPKEIQSLFLLQGAILGISGAAVGLLLGFLACSAIGGVRFEGAGFEKLMVSYQPSIYLYGLFSAVLAAVTAGYLPARAAKKMTPIDIIRSET